MHCPLPPDLQKAGEPRREPASSVPGNDVLQRGGQTCRAAFVQFGSGSRSCAWRWRSKAADGGEDGAHHRAGKRNFGQVEGDGAGVAHDAGADLDQLELKAGQRPVGHGLGQLDAAQKGGQVVGQRVQLRRDLVVVEPAACIPTFFGLSWFRYGSDWLS
jgi:hypothetical protein